LIDGKRMKSLDDTLLGKPTETPAHYDPGLLYPISRAEGRVQLALTSEDALPFWGEDLWNAYEVSWLDETGKPEVAMMTFRVPATSPFLVESKSLKLYLNSFNMSPFASREAVAATVEKDLSQAAGMPVAVTFLPPERFVEIQLGALPGKNLDQVAPRLVGYMVDASGLVAGAPACSESWVTQLFRSVCPVTGQPDWGTVRVSYTGPRIDPAGLLGYLISYRQHAGFHENCVERIFIDISERCRPTELTVAARFTRRGGLDINPVRATQPAAMDNIRDPRQ
jgi:7-cyano-7-deazaguanine reductase